MIIDDLSAHYSIPQAYIATLRQVKPGTLTLFVSDEMTAEKFRKPFSAIAMSLGLRYRQEIVTTTVRELQWHVGVRRVSAFDTSKEAYALVSLQKVQDYQDAARFLRRQLFNVLDHIDEPLTFYPQTRFRNVDFESLLANEPMSCKAMPQPLSTPPADGAPAGCNAISFSDEAIAPVDPFEDDLPREDEKKRWVDALTTLVLGYVSRFNEAPPMHLIEAELRGKLLLSASRPSPITVSGDMKIYLPELNEIELRMSPLAATVYILFLCHPEGIRLKEIADYRSELEEIYSMVKPGASENLARASINDLIDPMGESLQQKLSMTRKAVRRYILDPAIAANYIISGNRGEAYRIPLAPEMINLPATLRR